MLASVKKCVVAMIMDAPMNTLEFQKKKKPKVFTSFSDPSSSIPPPSPSLSDPSYTASPLLSSAQVSSSNATSTPSTQATSPRPPAPQVSSPQPQVRGRNIFFVIFSSPLFLCYFCFLSFIYYYFKTLLT